MVEVAQTLRYDAEAMWNANHRYLITDRSYTPRDGSWEWNISVVEAIHPATGVRYYRAYTNWSALDGGLSFYCNTTDYFDTIAGCMEYMEKECEVCERTHRMPLEEAVALRRQELPAYYRDAIEGGSGPHVRV